MNAVLYYSNAGECKRIAEYAADKTGYTIADVTKITRYDYETALLVFPVYCQNIPKTVCEFLSRLNCKNLAVIAAYGKMSHGNVLYEIQRKFNHNVIGAAYVPAKHAYLNEVRFNDFEKLDPLLNKLKSPATVKIPKSHKNVFANFAPAWRSRVGCKIIKNNALCNSCGICEQGCAENAIRQGKTNKKCIRCAKCVETCPNKALTLKLTAPLKRYLQKNKTDKLIIYM